MDLALNSRGWTWTRAPVGVEGPSAGAMSWSCGPDSDLWRLTGGGPIKHNSYAYLHQSSQDFTIAGEFDGDLPNRYDQVGFLIWGGERKWLKAGFEFERGEVLVGAVHTRSHSDWSRAASSLPNALGVQRREGTIEVVCRDVHNGWRMIRQLFLDGTVSVGPYSAAPAGPGFRASLTNFTMEADAE